MLRVVLRGSHVRGLLGAGVALGVMVALAAPPAMAAGGSAAAAAADRGLAPHRPGVVLVGYSANATVAQRGAARSLAGVESTSRLAPRGRTTVEVVTLAPGQPVSTAIARLRATPGVRYAEPDYLITKQATADDPLYTGGGLWGMYGDGTAPANEFGSAAGEAWSQGYTGSSSVAIGVIDEGIQVTHPDLAENIWTNPLEVAGNGVDDDANGYVDDIHGWDFVNNNSTVYDGTTAEGSDTHGTHVAGTIGGVGNNGTGVAGVNWSVTMVSAKFLGASGGYTSDAVRALDYLTALKATQGLKIVATSNSWGGGGASTSLRDAINRSGDQGILFVAAAGNSSSDNDVSGSYPSNYECTNGGTRGWDCVVAVASLTSAGVLSSFSSYGATTVDIAAPGSNINSSYPVNGYASLSGTSMATPHVSGAIALCASINPSLTPAELRAAVVGSARPTASLAGLVAGSGRLDIGAMVDACRPATEPVVGSPTSLAATASSSTTVSLTWSDGATGETAYAIDRAAFTSGSCGAFTREASVAADSTSFLVTGLTAATDYCFRVRATNNFGGGSSTVSAAVSVRTLDPPPPYVCEAQAYSWVDRTAGTPVLLALTDDSAAGVTLPFPVSFYGSNEITAQISSNGFVRFGSGAATSYANTSIPSASEPNNVLSPWWDDLNPGAGGTVWTLTTGSAPNRSFVVTWDGVAVYGLTGSAVTFQLVIDEATGDIVLQYLDAVAGSATSDNARSATVGVENLDATRGTQVGFNQAVVASGSALRCANSATSPPAITTVSLPVATTGAYYSTVLAASGGTAPYTWSLPSGSLPAGLALDGATGAITGTPSSAGNVDFTVRATDDAGQASSRSLSISVAAPVEVATSPLPDGTTGSPYSQTLSALGGAGPYVWSVTSGLLPTGLALGASTGEISGAPSVTGTFGFTVRATDSAGRTGSRVVQIVVGAPVSVSTSSLPTGTTGQSYAQSLAATGGTGPYSWSVSAGSLPVGLVLTSGGSITGTPSASGTASFTVRSEDSRGASATRSLSIAVASPVSVTTASLTSGTVGTSYSRTVAATGGTGAYTWAVTSGTLPAGLSLGASTGTISGTPTLAGTFTFTVRATDGASRTGSASPTITIAQVLPGTFGKSTPTSGSSGVSRTAATLTWAASTRAALYEYCFDSSRNSTCNGTWVSVGTNRSATISGLASKVSYEWQVRAVNTAGARLANGGTWWRFTSAA